MTQDMPSSHNEPAVRIFIGSGDDSVLECKTLIHSIKKNSSCKLEIWHYNGTSNTLISEIGQRRQCQRLPALPGHRFATEFSLFRYLIPQICNFNGKAIYLDSDMIVLGNIGALYDISLQGFDFAACSDAYPGIAPDRWALSAMLINCSVCRFDLGTIFSCIQQGRFSYAEFAQMGRRMQMALPYKIKRLPSAWNDFDKMDESTKLIHYTDLERQPWKYRYHPFGEPWFDYFRQAIDCGSIAEQEVQAAIVRGVARPDILKGNHGDDSAKTRIRAFLHDLRLRLRDIKRQVTRIINGTNA